MKQIPEILLLILLSPLLLIGGLLLLAVFGLAGIERNYTDRNTDNAAFK